MTRIQIKIRKAYSASVSKLKFASFNSVCNAHFGLLIKEEARITHRALSVREIRPAVLDFILGLLAPGGFTIEEAVVTDTADREGIVPPAEIVVDKRSFLGLFLELVDECLVDFEGRETLRWTTLSRFARRVLQ